MGTIPTSSAEKMLSWKRETRFLARGTQRVSFHKQFLIAKCIQTLARYDAMLETWSNTQCTIVVSFNWLPSSHANLFTLPPFTKISLRVQVHPSTLDLEKIPTKTTWNFNVTFDHASKHSDRSWVNFVYFLELTIYFVESFVQSLLFDAFQFVQPNLWRSELSRSGLTRDPSCPNLPATIHQGYHSPT